MTPNTFGFSETEIQEFKESFALFDTQGTGSVSNGDFRTVLESLQESPDNIYPHSDKILLQLSERADDDTMDFDDYFKLMASTSLQQTLQADADDRSNFSHVFELFDIDGKGYILVQDSEHVATGLGEQDMTREESAFQAKRKSHADIIH
jgi:Ca2+-binding EF-hand superfamily protein